MDRAIYELKSIIKRHEQQMKEQLEFIYGDSFKNNVAEPVEDNIDFVARQTINIYNNYFRELQKAIGVLERVGGSKRKRYRRRYR
jgi:hypothetical protein